eukprot:Blabericola_migrator_1__702@NODE_1174_length_5213_cov_40_985037_g798_i0_p5_GENE_NODE_1174_length_5213_cov_40_985037_g798_i0NODE_1174_length_5213_cov_40_985037_g798_i0_p5_ORF_typecomplete_len144_score17_40_NODE_1174_length_5213_cov_40_985037_g798_i012671698
MISSPYAVKFAPHLKSLRLFRSPVEVQPWPKMDDLPSGTTLTERTAHCIADRLALKIDPSELTTQQNEDASLLIPTTTLTSFWPYEPSWTHTGTMYVAYPEDLTSDHAMQGPARGIRPTILQAAAATEETNPCFKDHGTTLDF